MKKNKTPQQIWACYDKGISYKESLGVIENCRINQDFVNGKQWEGVNAPSIEKPVINIQRQAVDYYASMIVSDDIGILVDLKENKDEQVRKALEYVATNSIGEVLETSKFREKTRYFIKDCAINGDAFFFWRYNTSINLDAQYKGAIDLELIDSPNIIFGNPAEFDVQKQPYILVVQKLPTDEVKEMAKEEDRDNIMPDAREFTTAESYAQVSENYTVVLTYYWKEDGQVYWSRSTRLVELVPPINLETRLYPFVHQGWKRVKNSYHSVSPLTETRANQIMINKYYMMLNEFVKKLSFPKILYDGNVIKEWSNKVEAIKVNGIPNQAFAVTSPTVQLSSQFIQFAQDLIERTKQTLGVYDAALGNISNPDNTSAIVAVQKQAAQPLELQKLDYHQVVEDSVRIIVDLMSVHYGKRIVPIMVDGNNAEFEFDFTDLDFNEFNMNVEVGGAAYWNEINSVRTADNLYDRKMIDAKTYVEIQPTGYIPKKDVVLQSIQAQQEFMQQQAEMLRQQQPPM